MDKEKRIDEMLLTFYDTTTYEWMLDNPELASFDESNRIIVKMDETKIPDWVLDDINWWNNFIDRISGMQ